MKIFLQQQHGPGQIPGIGILPFACSARLRSMPFHRAATRFSQGYYLLYNKALQGSATLTKTYNSAFVVSVLIKSRGTNMH
jgi:hypothetical protein